MTAAEQGLKPLHVDPAEFRAELVAAARWVDYYLNRLPDQPVWTPMSDAQRRRLTGAELPEHGQPLSAVLSLVANEIASHPCGNGHPRFFAWITSPPSLPGIVAELLGAAINANCGAGEHALVDLERGVVRTLVELAGMPPGTGGVLTGGGSAANLLCLATARTWALRRVGAVDGADYDAAHARLVAYISDQAHMSIIKAAKTIGLPPFRVRRIPCRPDHSMDPDALDRAARDDRRAGLLPFAVVSTLGTTGTGAVDPVGAAADICQEHGMWHHGDGAWGGLGRLVGELAPLYTDVGRLDSLAVDPHKALCVPIDCSAALVADQHRLRDAFSAHPSYLDSDPEWPWLSEMTWELTRPGGRALKLWATLHTLGRRGVVELLERHQSLAATLRERIAAHPELTLCPSGPHPVVCFQHRAVAALPTELADTTHREVARRLQHEGRVYLATVDHPQAGVALRACICNYRTTDDDLALLVDEVARIGHAVASRACTNGGTSHA